MRKILFIALFGFIGCNLSFAQAIKSGMTSEQVKKVQVKISDRLGKYPLMFTEWKSESERKVKLERVAVTPSHNRIHLYFNEPLGQISMREDLISQWEQMVRDTLGTDFKACRVQLYCKGTPVERLVPNLYRKRLSVDSERQSRPSNKAPLVQNLDKPLYGKGLAYKHIALWASHGRYYDQEKGAWIWQRPPLFGAIEDLNSFEYTYRYLIPMLENAGAVVMSPRERDPNPVEQVVDETQARILSGNWQKTTGGFAAMERLRDENPFEQGYYLRTTTGGSVEYPVRASKGEYALYVSYKSSPSASTQVEYEVIHAGGSTRYRVNQQIGAGWVYVGTHIFDSESRVIVSSTSGASTDAIRIGGGMGNVERAGMLSGLPRWAEGARYYLQYSGVPASIYAEDTEKDKEPQDYKDDYKCRGNWARWMQNEKGVPFDASIALHTNAGINDTIFGSLTINYTDKFKGKYSNGKNKYAGRDLADIVMTQIVDDIRSKYTKQWTRRSMYDKGYREVVTPDSPSIIIELLSHQNMNDMIYALDPEFRFDACRAIYKGILKFMADRYSQPYVVQPLPPHAFTMDYDNGKLKLRWREQPDELEPTAKPTGYRVYTRIGDGGFDNGTTVYDDTELELPIERDGVVRSYKITAMNEGGESFPTEILSSCFLSGKDRKVAMVVNEFTRTSPPDTVKGGLTFDNFMPYQHDYGVVGKQYDFDRKSEFVDNDNPGWGASRMDIAAIGVEGNSFDYTVKRGRELINEGLSYVSSSKDGYIRRQVYEKVVAITERIP